MVQKIDDYYSQITQSPPAQNTSESSSGSTVIKKKIKIKAKTSGDAETVSAPQVGEKTLTDTVSSETSEKHVQSSVSLNEALEQYSKPKLTIVKRA
jgi:hypothetical protein